MFWEYVNIKLTAATRGKTSKQRMNYYEIFTIVNVDCLFMKVIGNQPITKADC
jgi:hypothetical protein